MDTPDSKPDAPSTVRNRDAILAVLKQHFADRRRVLEIGSGSGQHAIYFAAALPHLQWQTSDRNEQLPGIQAWLNDAALANTPPAIALDVNQPDWPTASFDAVFSANTLHILSWPEVERLFAALPSSTQPDCKLLIYGPFNADGGYTSDSNAAFDRWLKTQSPDRGIRDFAAVNALATAAGFELLANIAMPANNRCLLWQRQPLSPQPSANRRKR